MSPIDPTGVDDIDSVGDLGAASHQDVANPKVSANPIDATRHNDISTNRVDIEGARVARLRAYGILDTPPEETFDRITRLASDIVGTPITLISLVDSERQWFKSRIGLEASETPRDFAFCDHTIRTPDVLVVEDATSDPRFADNPLVVDGPRIRFYAGAPLTTEDGYRIGTLCAIDTKPRGISERETEALRDLAQIVMSELRLRQVVSVASSAQETLYEAINALPDGFVLYDRSDRLVICNDRYREIYAESADLMVPGARFEDIIRIGVARGQYPDAKGREEEWIRDRLFQHNNPSQPIEQHLPGGAWLRIEECKTSDGGLVGFRIDISELKRREKALRKLASRDPLTDLPNRSNFNDRLAMAVANSKRTGLQVGLMLLDLDRFKQVNDSHGHDVGDELLRLVAARIRSCCRETDTVARLGGDEFAVISTNIDEPSGITALAERIIAEIGSPFRIHNTEIHTGTSIGITIFPGDFNDIEGLMRHADLALYRAKTEGRGGWQLYDEELHEAARHRRTIEHDLRVAIDNDELCAFFQPQIDMASGRITGSEALLRWRHPERGLIAPGEFIAIAEATRMIVPISEWMMRTACRQNAAWLKAGLPAMVMAVNVSPVEFHLPEFTDNTRRALDDAGLDPSLLELEITEHSAMDDRVDTLRIFDQIRSLGVRLAIDDFGTGYSSLSRLKAFQVSRLKIDRSFVRDITDDRDDAAICASVIQLGQSLDMDVIAEGVETEAQLDKLRELGCTQMQGFHFARPMPAEDFADFVRAFALPEERAKAS